MIQRCDPHLEMPPDQAKQQLLLRPGAWHVCNLNTPLVTLTEADAAVDVATPLKKSFLNTTERSPNGVRLPVEINHQTPGPVLRSHSIPQVTDQIPSQPYRAP